MTTSDDDSLYGDPNASADQPADLMVDEPPAERRGRGLLLATLAGLAVAVLGIVAWALLYVQVEREFVGVSVVIGFVAGWLIRVVSGRHDLPPRIIAVVITAIACVVGTVVAEVAFTASEYGASFTQLLGDVLPETFTILSKRPLLTLAVFVAALVLAFLSAGPQSKDKTSPQVAPLEPLDEDPPHPGEDDDRA